MNRSHLKAWILTSSIVSALCAQPISAQVVPDNTLPAGERSQVSSNPNVKIDGGARRGGNLFHSFSQFSIPTGGTAFFNNAADVQNILTRVTGGALSNLDGLIRANGTANLFLLNPNGILFGPNASLNIGGSFVATTANAIGFPNGEVFSSNATQPLPSQLLTVNPNAFFFNQLTPQPIIVQSRFDERVFNQSSFSGTGLHVPPGQNLLLVGGPIQLDSGEPFRPTIPPGQPLLVFFNPRRELQPDGGWLISPGSNVELGAVGGVGTAGLSTASSDWQLTIPNAVPKAVVSFSNGSGIDVRGASGSIRVLAQNIDIYKSLLYMGIPRDSRLSNTQTGDLELNATGSITLNMSLLTNDLFGQGTTGSINLTAGDRVSLELAAIYHKVRSTGVGNAGDINITTKSLSFTRRSTVHSETNGRGNVGNVNVNAYDTVSFDDFSRVESAVRFGGVGNAGDINITTGSLSLFNNSRLSLANAGNININAHDTVSLTRNSWLASLAGKGVNAGNININASNTILLDQSRVYSDVYDNASNTGNTNITTGSLSLTNGSNISSRTGSRYVGGSPVLPSNPGQGNAGSVTINARDRISIDGEGVETFTLGEVAIPILYSTSAIYTTVGSGAVGQGGDVTLTTNSLSLTNGGAVNTSTAGRGNAGRVTINAHRSVEISGTGLTRPDRRSGVFTSAQPGAVGNAGDIDITARSLLVLNGARLSASTVGAGDTGNIISTAPEIFGLPYGSFTITEPSARGSGGNVRVVTESLEIQNQAEVTVSSSGTGSAGSLFVDADRIFLNNGGRIRADTTSGGGNINLRSPFILLRNGSDISTNATGANIPGGNIGIDTRFLLAVLKEDSNISANSEDFRGGNVRINATSIYGIQSSFTDTPFSDITATGATSTLNGTIDVITSGLDPTSGLVELPADLVDASRLIAQGCPADRGNSFVITGRGGLPPTPEQQLDDDAAWSDRRRLTVAQPVSDGRGVRSQKSDFDLSAQPNGASMDSKLRTQTSSKGDASRFWNTEGYTALKTPADNRHPTPDTPITEATGWQVTPAGEIFLVANTPNPTVQNRLNQAVACQGR